MRRPGLTRGRRWAGSPLPSPFVFSTHCPHRAFRYQLPPSPTRGSGYLKQGKILALVGVLVVAPMALAQGSGGSPKPSEGKTAARALEVYEQGKRLYDAKNYAGALERFEQAAAIEPDKARWQYNRGLALRKLKRFAEAREALLHSRILDPAYKQAEIDDKLRE